MTKNQKIALMTLPALALVLLGSSVADIGIASANIGIERDRGLTSEQRAVLLQARELRKEGNNDEARALLKDAGLNPKMRHHRMKHMGGAEMRAEHKVIKQAIEDNDFTAFKNATAEAPFAAMVTKENFAKLVEAHTLRKSGDKEGARTLLKDLGFPHGGHGMK